MAETPSVVPAFNPEMPQNSNEVHIMHSEDLSPDIKAYSQIALAKQAREAIAEANPVSLVESRPDTSREINWTERPIDSAYLAGQALAAARAEKLAA